MSQPSILDARLAEIDRRLSTIQSGLAPDGPPPSAGPRSPAPVGPPPPPPSPPLRSRPVTLRQVPPPALADASELIAELRELIAELRELTVAHERLLASTRELLSSYADALAGASAGSQPSAAPLDEFSVSAGPFTSTEALRDFERALGRLPEVREVAVRGYEGDDRAIVDVHLFEPTS